MHKLSAVIITLNEEQNIERCLRSLRKAADEIVVVDSYSKDKTKEICLAYKARFISRKWEGYSRTKNFANQKAKHDWILSLDADEELSEELICSILDAKKKGFASFYQIHRLTNYCGHWVRYSGWQRDVKVRLFHRKEANWEGDYVHEKLLLTSPRKSVLLAGDCYHYTVVTQKEHLEKIDHYSDLAAQKLLHAGKKTDYSRLILQPSFEFIKKFFLKLGFLDGYIGFVIARNSAKAIFLRYEKLRQLRRGSTLS